MISLFCPSSCFLCVFICTPIIIISAPRESPSAPDTGTSGKCHSEGCHSCIIVVCVDRCSFDEVKRGEGVRGEGGSVGLNRGPWGRGKKKHTITHTHIWRKSPLLMDERPAHRDWMWCFISLNAGYYFTGWCMKERCINDFSLQSSSSAQCQKNLPTLAVPYLKSQ